MKSKLVAPVFINAKGGISATLLDLVKTPLAFILLLVIMGIFATLTIASAISGELTAAAAAAAGFIIILVLLTAIKILGK